MGNKPSVVEASTAHEDEGSRSGEQATDKEGEMRIWASHMYTVTQNARIMKPIRYQL